MCFEAIIVVFSGVIFGWILPLMFLIIGEDQFTAGDAHGHTEGDLTVHVLKGLPNAHAFARIYADALRFPGIAIAENSSCHSTDANVQRYLVAERCSCFSM